MVVISVQRKLGHYVCSHCYSIWVCPVRHLRERGNASVFDRNSPHLNSMIDLPTALSRRRGRITGTLKMRTLKIVDALNVQTEGDIFEGIGLRQSQENWAGD